MYQKKMIIRMMWRTKMGMKILKKKKEWSPIKKLKRNTFGKLS